MAMRVKLRKHHTAADADLKIADTKPRAGLCNDCAHFIDTTDVRTKTGMWICIWGTESKRIREPVKACTRYARPGKL